MADVILTPDALADIQGMCAGICDSESAALVEASLTKLEALMSDLGGTAYTGKLPDELTLFGNRTILEAQEQPWRILYRRHASTVYILGIFDRRRALHAVLHERLIRS